MAKEPDNIVLAILRKIDQRTERMAEDLQDLKVRVTSVEEGLAGVNRRLDRLENRVERIEHGDEDHQQQGRGDRGLDDRDAGLAGTTPTSTAAC